MANISLNVELPAHSHSFQVQVPDSASIANIKFEISKSCPGGPKVEGQKAHICRKAFARRRKYSGYLAGELPPHDPFHRCRLLISGTHPSRALNTREPFTWPYNRQLGRLVRQRDALYDSSRSLRPPRHHPCCLHRTRHRFTHNTLTDNCISSLSIMGTRSSLC
jgi:hypothetical protein